VYAVDLSARPAAEGERVLPTGATIDMPLLEHSGRSYTPCFSSTSRVQAFVKEPVRTLGMTGRAFLELVGPTHVVLNPASTVWKTFVPDEIARLLRGDVEGGDLRKVRVERERQVLVGAPAEPQEHLTKALSAAFSGVPGVVAAHLAWMFDRESGVAPHALVGIDTEGPWDQATAAAVAALRKVARKDEVVDVWDLRKTDLADAIRQQPAFYRRG
jgi:hypothetical protein